MTFYSNFEKSLNLLDKILTDEKYFPVTSIIFLFY
jgi:hypothetical protein